jgi:DNA-3-methyladenine glycosylase I
MTKPLRPISDGKNRCGWVGGKPHFIAYHDREWGAPVHDDRKHFEMLLLEGAQAGLTWETILLRRDGYRRAFAEFDPKKVARFTAKQKAVLLKDAGIIRNRLKIDSAVTNAQAFLTIKRSFVRSIATSGVRGRQTDREPLGQVGPGAGDECGQRCIVEGSQEAWFPVCRQHDRLCLHAGGWAGERSHD